MALFISTAICTGIGGALFVGGWLLAIVPEPVPANTTMPVILGGMVLFFLGLFARLLGNAIIKHKGG